MNANTFLCQFLGYYCIRKADMLQTHLAMIFFTSNVLNAHQCRHKSPLRRQYRYMLPAAVCIPTSDNSQPIFIVVKFKGKRSLTGETSGLTRPCCLPPAFKQRLNCPDLLQPNYSSSHSLNPWVNSINVLLPPFHRGLAIRTIDENAWKRT